MLRSIKHAQKMGISVIVRDPIEEVLATLDSPKGNSIDPVVAKSFAALRAIMFVKDMGRQKILLEGDAL